MLGAVSRIFTWPENLAMPHAGVLSRLPPGALQPHRRVLSMASGRLHCGLTILLVVLMLAASTGDIFAQNVFSRSAAGEFSPTGGHQAPLGNGSGFGANVVSTAG